MTIYTTQSKGRGQPGSPEASSLKPEAPRLAPRASPRSPQAGFALIITITLLAFLLLVMVGLATFTKVETSVSDNALKQTQARQNAIMAMNIAIGQLQKHAGPDARVTATSGFAAGTNNHLTGVWYTTNAANPVPVTWLVSGNEGAALLATNPATALTVANSITLVDTATVGTTAATDKVLAPLVNITAANAAGQAGNVTVGRYAWWAGDEGVKAALGLRDRGEEVNYKPWDTDVQKRRIRQQISGGPVYFRDAAAGHYGFDPTDATNAAALPKIVTTAQVANLKPVLATASMPAFLQAHFHELTLANYGVLANTRADAYRGLMQDLSLAPSGLGANFVAYANYPAYMESPAAGNTAVPQITSLDSARRRYNVTVPSTKPAAAGLPQFTFGVSPVLTTFFLQFGFSRGSPATTVTTSCRLYVELWNPYTAALVPPTDLSLEISGLPQITVSGVTVDLGQNLPTVVAAGNKLSVNLPLTASLATPADGASWLPGRQYSWVTSAAPGAKALTFYNKAISGYWDYPTTVTIPGTSSTGLSVDGPAVSGLTITLKNSQGTLATYVAPNYLALHENASTTKWKFAFAFRLKQPSSLDADRTWLQTYDPRGSLGINAVDVYDPTLEQTTSDPNQFLNNSPVSSQYLNQFLLYRTQGKSVASDSASNDVPLFELPRMPFLSVGELQHVQVAGARPFAIGNSWGGAVNGIFDRFFFSGLPTTGTRPTLANREPLPNWNLLPVDSRPAPAASLTLDDLRAGNNAADPQYPFSSRFLLQAGAFNVNSTSAVAWRAVLSGLRFPAGRPFQRLKLDNTNGSTNLGTQNAATPTVDELFNQDTTLGGTAYSGPAFFRFPQSAQETYDWILGGTTIHSQALTTQAFRQGVRSVNTYAGFADTSFATPPLHYLTLAQIETLATTIAGSVTTRLAASGPFQNLEEFLSVSPLFGGKSLLEKAIADAAINDQSLGFTVAHAVTDPGFSSLTLTQADLMAALAPYLRTRSDTFTIRTYGEATNMVSGTAEAKAWAEAVVQRLPYPVDPTDNIVQPLATGFGRKFKIISFRWLNLSDL